jgi:hypothetical protein
LNPPEEKGVDQGQGIGETDEGVKINGRDIPEEGAVPELDDDRGPEEEGDHHGPEEHEPLDPGKEAVPRFLSGLGAFHRFSL